MEKASRTNCAVCMEDIHTSRISSHIPPCGHMIHKPCFRMLVDRGYYACPTCNVAMFKMDSVSGRGGVRTGWAGRGAGGGGLG